MEEVLKARVSTTTYVSYLYPGLIVSNESNMEVPDRNPEREARREAADSAFGFSYFDIVSAVVEIGETLIQTTSNRRNISCTYYIDGEVLDIDQVAALPGDHQIMLDNMRCNDWDRVVRCRSGNFQPFDESDALVRST